MAFGIPAVDPQPSHRGERPDHIDFSRIPSDFILLSLSIATVDWARNFLLPPKTPTW